MRAFFFPYFYLFKQALLMQIKSGSQSLLVMAQVLLNTMDQLMARYLIK